MKEQYQPQEIEKHVQAYWRDNNSFLTTEDINKEKFYCLSMLPYPSGRIHMGHVRNYTIGDAISRYQRMLGKNVLQPMGWDAFGLPAENAAIQRKVPPAEWTKQNIDEMRKQLQSIGFGYDWSREVTTCAPEYYHWEQWFFIQLYKKGLVYKKNAEVNWDPVDQTVLANEQVVDGRGWRSGALVERREIPQWFLKITAYAEELLNDIDTLTGWPEQVKTMQRNWIGRSEGIEITFPVANHEPLIVFTTRPDTLFGVSFLAIAPAHPLAKAMAKDHPEIQQFIQECGNTKTAEADIATLEKRGIPLNIHAQHPITGENIPIWIANFVVMDYGSGALMAVPAHDERDFEFANKYRLPIKQVIKPIDQDSTCDIQANAYTDYGILFNSGDFSGLTSKEAFTALLKHLEQHQLGTKKVNYRLRDWSVSRQRYWGAPIPFINCAQCGTVPVAEQDLPVILPEDVSFSGVTSPLKSIPSFLETTCPQCKGPAQRETDTFDTFVESSWYYARYTCKKQNKAMLDGRANYWLPVDHYIGGIEHAVLHLLYARFFHKLMRDTGLVNSDEPFTRLLTQGMVLNQGIKMSKSKGNTVDPQALIEKYGADTVRLFMMFAAPPEQSLEWSESGAEGAYRFLKRMWAFAYENKTIIHEQNCLENANLRTQIDWENADPAQTDIFRQVYQVLDQTKYDYERQQFNTVVSSCMKLLNLLNKLTPATENKIDIHHHIIHHTMSILLRVLAPITPHITHQLWVDLHYKGNLLDANWPKSSQIAFKMETIELVVQVNGKLRSRIRVPQSADQAAIEHTVKADEKVKNAVAGKNIKRIITVPGKLVNVVTGE